MSTTTEPGLENQSPPDRLARDQIRTDLGHNLFVEAGAGAGKTTSLVGRILSLVATGVELEQIAAITFTEKAAAELRQRVRTELGDAIASPDSGPGESARYRRALDQLDRAAIGTLHAFARRLLSEFPIAAGLPPGFSVLDEIESNMRFDDEWEEFLDGLLSDPDAAPLAGGSDLYAVCSFDNFGIIAKTPIMASGFERIARDFQANWDLVEQRVDRSDPGRLDIDTAVSRLVSECEQIGLTNCPAGDTQEAFCARLRDLGRRLARSTTLSGKLRSVDEIASIPSTRKGNQTNWKNSAIDLGDLRDRQQLLVDDARRVVDRAKAYRRHLVGAILANWVLQGVRKRRTDGTVLFHDLLVLARQLLASNPVVRAALHERYQRILLDEFQDTDPIQLEIAVRITAADDDPDQRPGGNWRMLVPAPGRLFIVGDPKQSIYRFRRADIGQYLAAAEQLSSTEVSLSANFRSTTQVIDWVNAVFADIITETPNAQPGFRPLTACRAGDNSFGSVRLLGSTQPVPPPLNADGEPGDVNAEWLRVTEAAQVAAAVATAIDEAWEVRDGDQIRACTPGDVCILLPARSSLPFLERALTAAGIPYRAENSAVVYTTTEIRNLMLALHALDDPTDELRLVAALRSPLFGVSDVDLYGWRTGGGRWSIWSEPPQALIDHPVATAFAKLGQWARTAWERTPADLIAEVVDECRLLDAALDHADARDVWRRVRFTIEHARAWSDSGGHGLRRYLRWVERQASEARTGDTVLPEHDHDAVRIMTVHAAKGLEFPITVVSGMTSEVHRQFGVGVVWTDDDWAITKKNEDPKFEEFAPVDEQMGDAERRRLLYVACTRAADHLVVSCVHKDREIKDGKETNAELILTSDPFRGAEELEFTADRLSPTAKRAVTLQNNDPARWHAARQLALDAASRLHSLSATGLATGTADSNSPDPGLEKEPVDIDLPPWQRGRYGTAVGRAVHAVLQFCDLETGADIDAFAAAQCSAEGILGMDALVAGLARSALAAPVVQRAATTAHHRELFVAAPIGDRTLEGYIDLFVETEAGGIIVDYKTDQFSDDAERVQRLEKYRLQLASYGVALEAVLGHSVDSAVIVRCLDGQAAEQIAIDRWDEALDEARKRAAALIAGS